jgi:hypothetical protein
MRIINLASKIRFALVISLLFTIFLNHNIYCQELLYSKTDTISYKTFQDIFYSDNDNNFCSNGFDKYRIVYWSLEVFFYIDLIKQKDSIKLISNVLKEFTRDNVSKYNAHGIEYTKLEDSTPIEFKSYYNIDNRKFYDFIKLFDSYKMFWKLTGVKNDYDNSNGLLTCNDNDLCKLYVCQKGQYNYVGYYYPDDKQFFDICFYIMELANIKYKPSYK